MLVALSRHTPQKNTSQRRTMSSLVKLIGSLEERGNGPLYQRLQDALRSAIQTRALRPNEALPAERDLAEDLSISRITVRKALDGLVEEGLLTRKQGAGTFVASRVEKNFSKLTSFSEDMAARGLVVSSTWVSRTRTAVTPEEAMALGLSPGSAVYRFVRGRHESARGLEGDVRGREGVGEIQ